MNHDITRRAFLAAGTAACALPLLGATQTTTHDLPLVDLHVHLDNSTIDDVVALARERGVRFGIVEHAGTKENKYPVVLSNDEELAGYVAMLEGKPVYKGVQTEWNDWMGCFSREALAKLDFVLTDAMTFPAPDGHRMKLWEDGVDLGDTATFMDRYVDWHVAILEQQPIDVLANVSWYPTALGAYAACWTDARIEKVVAAAAKNGVAIEISSGFRLPELRFLKMAKEAGIKFCFGSNGRYPKMGKLGYSLRMAQELGLAPADLYVPQGARAAHAKT